MAGAEIKVTMDEKSVEDAKSKLLELKEIGDSVGAVGKAPWWLAPGMRKVTVLAPPMIMSIITCSVAFLFIDGRMSAPEYQSAVTAILKWGGFIFVGGNVVERVALAMKKPSP